MRRVCRNFLMFHGTFSAKPRWNCSVLVLVFAFENWSYGCVPNLILNICVKIWWNPIGKQWNIPQCNMCCAIARVNYNRMDARKCARSDVWVCVRAQIWTIAKNDAFRMVRSLLYLIYTKQFIDKHAEEKRPNVIPTHSSAWKLTTT